MRISKEEVIRVSLRYGCVDSSSGIGTAHL